MFVCLWVRWDKGGGSWEICANQLAPPFSLSLWLNTAPCSETPPNPLSTDILHPFTRQMHTSMRNAHTLRERHVQRTLYVHLSFKPLPPASSHTRTHMYALHTHSIIIIITFTIIITAFIIIIFIIIITAVEKDYTACLARTPPHVRPCSWRSLHWTQQSKATAHRYCTMHIKYIST